MRGRAIADDSNIRRRVRARAHFVLSHIRLSAIYAGLLIVVAIAWGASALYVLRPASAPQYPTSSSAPMQSMTIPDPQEKGGGMPMSASTPSTNSSDSSHASVQATNDGTTVTVNGDSATVPLNQSFNRSYSSSSNGTVTHTDVSVENNSTDSGRTVTLNMQSHSQSTASGTHINGGQ